MGLALKNFKYGGKVEKILGKKINKRRYKGRKISFLFLVVCIILFALIIINISDLFSSILTNEKSLFYKDKIEIPSYSVYAVSIKHFELETDAENFAHTIIEKGGMGVVYESGEYYCIGSIYPTLLEAQEVRDNLIILGYSPRILNIKVQEIAIDYKGDEKESTIHALNIFRESFLELYNMNVDLDKGNIERVNVNGIVATQCLKVKDIQNKFLNSNNSLSENIKTEIGQGLNHLYESLEEILLTDKTDLEFTSLIKQNMFDIILTIKNITDAINIE